ncbi:hypothetical protein ACJX0J_020241, partial [Zea mays]
ITASPRLGSSPRSTASSPRVILYCHQGGEAQCRYVYGGFVPSPFCPEDHLEGRGVPACLASPTEAIPVSSGEEMEAGDTADDGRHSPSKPLRGSFEEIIIQPPLLGGSGDLVRVVPDPSIWGGTTLTWMSTEGDLYFVLDNTEEREMWEELRVMTQLALRSAEVADLTSRCAGLKEEAAAERAKVRLLVDEVHRLKAEAVVVEQDKSRHQVVEASLRVDSLSKHLEAERFEGQALKAQMG